MARQRQAQLPPSQDTIVQLRLDDHTRTDWRGNAEGWLLLYDPAVVGKREFDQLFGMQMVAASALRWMGGEGGGFGLVAAPEHWCGFSRKVAAEKVALLVKLGWMQAFTTLPFCISDIGADIRIREGGLTADERQEHREYHRRERGGRTNEPHSAWITSTKGKLALTWDFLLGFKSKQKATMFGPGHSIEFAWPKGTYHAKGWSFETLEDADGMFKDRFLIQLETQTDAE